jgi:urease accessory protein
MLHAHSFRTADAVAGRDFADSVVLAFEDRRRRRGTVTTLGGLEVLVDLEGAPTLAHGDAYELADGRLIEIVAEAEDLLEVRGRDPRHLIRLAWHLGNRHLETEIGPKWLRIRRDHVIADMLRGLGGKVVEIEGPFQPEGGAYEHGRHAGHAHEHHDHDVRHHDHDHGNVDTRHREHEHSEVTHHDRHDHSHDDEEPPEPATKRVGKQESDPRRTGPEDKRSDRMNDAPQFR